ncbi:DNA polymerase III subunit delta [Schaalia suimastitidis]|uniref:DNA polymerase III subunit delta n=1 Tax=Schaalia suimastitidis TaxID=121163 RepID=UPI0004793781|nr:DNA polymerase III subunit delta [Schaalia suimastitidis]
MATRTSRTKTPQAASISLAPIVVIRGSEELLADRALSRLRALALQEDPAVEREELQAATYQAGQLFVVTSPSLFGESRFITIPDLETLSDQMMADLLEYAKEPAPDVWLVMRHPGGNARGKKLLDVLAQSGYPIIAADPLKWDSDKLALLAADAKAAGRTLEGEAAQLLVDALGSDVASMAAALAQLLSDVEGTITVEDVKRYHSGRVEATGFEVADAAVEGRSAEALTLLRHALATGLNPVPIVAVLALKIRQIARVMVSASASPHSLGMSPRQLQNIRRQARSWNDQRLAAAVEAIACADEEVKGASKDPERAVEKAVITVCRLSRA